MPSEGRDMSGSSGPDTAGSSRSVQESEQSASIKRQAHRQVVAAEKETHHAQDVARHVVVGAIGFGVAVGTSYLNSRASIPTLEEKEELDQCRANLRVKPTHFHPITVNAGSTTTVNGPTVTKYITVTETASHETGNNPATSRSKDTQF